MFHSEHMADSPSIMAFDRCFPVLIDTSGRHSIGNQFFVMAAENLSYFALSRRQSQLLRWHSSVALFQPIWGDASTRGEVYGVCKGPHAPFASYLRPSSSCTWRSPS
jgi:hypothetical protein